MRYLNFEGNCTEALGVVVGPNALRERLTIVAVEYSTETDTTRASLKYGIHGHEDGCPVDKPNRCVCGMGDWIT